ncbi:Swp82p NDAI_0A06660 [Naumovozyma dairenensis CBS 421]|uniref:Uncharacterized protein n=1 Tax=Naumovozyma dairenensis (strain ATCC 10597 / BCRC 20456 / CBS 421 / NBRC 0211 / NRRL Y-12639) TaxID=1071378 RepID=G0W4T2_NAUDC|nr:hypothetical protein NDAI_0A06660 [Naumovozyma dairenensis CBS 421]CCD22820.1 hypothetical protein NDAI_0A06660 [Naumovozyma dairenensis CBS 421]
MKTSEMVPNLTEPLEIFSNPMSSEHLAKIISFTNEKQLCHNKTLLKHFHQIADQSHLLLGPLNEFPLTTVEVPNFTDVVAKSKAEPEETLSEDTGVIQKEVENCSYVMSMKDEKGEEKINANGLLTGNKKCFLFDIFTFNKENSDTQQYFVLVNDLIKALLYTGTEEEFLSDYKNLLPLVATGEELDFLRDHALANNENLCRYVTTKSAFVQFGAQVVTSGFRIIDDYWEDIALKQNLTPHHRVHKYSDRLIDILHTLYPSSFEDKDNETHLADERITQSLERDIDPKQLEYPAQLVSEQNSKEIREDYGRNFNLGQHIDVVVPGQNIVGSVELNSQFRIPKYHSKNSFLQASQIGGLDVSIGKHSDILNPSVKSSTELGISGELVTNFPLEKTYGVGGLKNAPTNSISNTVLTEGLLPTNIVHQVTQSKFNINGWKFDTLPLKNKNDNLHPPYSIKGLPYFDEDKLFRRLNCLTPNQIKDVEHLHDSLFLNTGLQNVRTIRKKKWQKYWQYKSGIPIGLQRGQRAEFLKKYLPNLMNETIVTTTYNETTNTDETRKTRKIVNPNFIGNSNIKGFKPPYILPPKEDQAQNGYS